MSTQNMYAGFFPRQIIGRSVMKDDVHGSIRQDFGDIAGKVYGEAVIDPLLVGLGITVSADALNERRLTIVGDLPVINDDGDIMLAAGSTSSLVTVVEGARTITLHDPAWFVSLPYENANGTTYNVYAGMTKYPCSVDIGRNSNRGYGRWVDVVGFTTSAEAVTDTGTHLRLDINANLTGIGMEDWLTANVDDDNWSYDCVVFIDEDAGSIASDDSDVAISYFAKLKKAAVGAGWQIDLDDGGDGYLGQGASFDTTAANYTVVILGPLITTTNYDSNSAWTHIGTVASAGAETISTVSQIITKSISDMVVDFAAIPLQVLSKGWITPPVVTVAPATQANVAGGGVAFTAGKIDNLSAVTGTFAGLAAGTEYYIVYNPATGAYETVLTADLAVAGNMVPVFRMLTDGGSNIVESSFCGRMVDNFPDTVALTLSDSADNGAFSDLASAIGYMRMVSNLTNAPKSFRVDVVGGVTQGTAIVDGSDDEYSIPDVHFVGARRGSASTNDNGGACISWSATQSLFQVSTGTIDGWTFENIRFRYLGNATNIDIAVMHIATGARNVVFDNCVFDGVTSAGAQGLGTAFYASQPTTNIRFIDCRFEVTDVGVYYTSAPSGISGLELKRCKFDQTTFTPGFATQGFVVADGIFVSNENVRMTDCEYVGAQGPILSLFDCAGLWFSGNEMVTSVDTPLFDVGLGDTGAVVSKLFIRDNTFVCGVANSGAVMAISSGESPAAILVSNNYFNGTGSVHPAIIASGFGTSSWSIHNNVIDTTYYGIIIGVVLDTFSGLSIRGNIISGGVTGIVDNGATTLTNCNISGNNVSVSSGSCIDLGDINNSVIDCNVLKITTSTGPVLLLAGSYNVIVNNVVHDAAGATAYGIRVPSGTDNVVSSNSVQAGGGAVYSIYETANDRGCVGGNSAKAGVYLGGASSTVHGNYLGDDCVLDGTLSNWSGNNIIGDIQISSGVDAPIMSGNKGGLVTGVNSNSVWSGNYFTSITNHATGTCNNNVFACNRTDLIFSGTGQTKKNIAVANYMTGSSSFASTNLEWSMAGNVFSGTITLTHDDSSLTGNFFGVNLVLSAASSALACVGNHVVGTLTDNGANTTANNS